MGSCLKDFDCHDRGECVEYICHCEEFIAGEHCEITFAEELGVGFLVFRFGFMILFLALALFNAVQVYRIKQEGSLRKLRGICLCFILGHATLRAIYLAADNVGQTNNIQYLLQQLIYIIALFSMISSYLVAVLYWVDMYHERLQKGKVFVKKTKYLFIVLDVILFIISIAQSIAYGDLVTVELQPLLLKVYDFYVAIIGFGQSSVMLIYGTLVYYKKKNLFKQFPAIANDMSKIVKLTSILMIISATIYLVTILLITMAVLNLTGSPRAAIISVSICYVLEFTLDVEMLYLMTPRSSSSFSPSSSSSSSSRSSLSPPPPKSSSSSESPPSSFINGIQLEIIVRNESSDKQQDNPDEMQATANDLGE